jgi:Ca2+-binding EF-hand superfamily protein
MDESGMLSRSELHALLVGINFGDVDFDRVNAVNHVMHELDESRKDMVNQEEFVAGMKRWINKAMSSEAAASGDSFKFFRDYHEV